MRPRCVLCGNYLLPCTATTTGIHPKVVDATTGRVIYDHTTEPTTVTMDALLKDLPDPDIVGQSEYRAVFDLLVDATSGYEDDSGMTPKEWVLAILDEVDRAVRLIRRSTNA